MNSLQVLPAVELSNSEEKLEVVVREEWDEESIEFSKKCIRESSVIYFRPSSDIKDEEITFGELIIQKPSGETYELSRKLCEEKMASRGSPNEKFLNVFNRSISSVIDRWNDNGRSGGILKYPDMLMVTEIAEPSEFELVKIFKLKKVFEEAKRKAADLTEYQDSIAKCRMWAHQNQGYLTKATPSTSQDGPSTSRDVPSTSKDLPTPSTSKNISVSGSPHATTSPISLKPMSQILESLRGMSVKNTSLEMTMTSNTSSGASSRPSKKIILVPAGGSMNTNNKSPTYVNENFDSVEEAVEAVKLNDLRDQMESLDIESSESENAMQPFIKNNRRSQRSDCCVSQ